MKIDFIGTSAGTPTSKYGTSGIFINTGQRKLLLDCGEGTQKRIMKFGSSINIDDIFLTHLDSDHTLGVPGLIRTLDLNNRNRDLDIHASEDMKPKLKTLIAGVHGWPSYTININCFDSGGLVKSFDDFDVKCFKTIHDSSSYGFIIDEDDKTGRLMAEKAKKEYNLDPSPKYQKLKNGQPVKNSNGMKIYPDDLIGEDRSGRKIIYTGDTAKSDNVKENSSNADLLIHDSTFSYKDAEKASKTEHSTSKEAAEVADDADVDFLVLSHISPRYDGVRDRFVDEAKEYFDGKIKVAKDGMRVNIQND